MNTYSDKSTFEIGSYFFSQMGKLLKHDPFLGRPVLQSPSLYLLSFYAYECDALVNRGIFPTSDILKEHVRGWNDRNTNDTELLINEREQIFTDSGEPILTSAYKKFVQRMITKITMHLKIDEIGLPDYFYKQFDHELTKEDSSWTGKRSRNKVHNFQSLI